MFHFDPPRVRLNDFGVAARGSIPPLRRASAVDDPSPSPNRARLVVLGAVGLGLLLALALVVMVVVRQRRLAAVQPRRLQPQGARFPARREFLRVHGDRVRVALDERGADFLIVGLGLAAAVALAALIAG